MKKQLLSVLAIAFATSSFAQSVFNGTGYFDGFDDGEIAATAEDGWYNDKTIYPSIVESDGKLVVTAAEADSAFKGFGLYIKSTNAIDITNNPVVKFSVTNNGTAPIRLRVDLKLVDPDFPAGQNCPAELGDTINANTDPIIVPAGETVDAVYDYEGSGYEYNTTCEPGAGWNPEIYPVENFTRVAGLYIVINGGAGESWCNPASVCSKFSGTVSFDNLQIGSNVDGILKGSKVSSISISPNPASDFTTLTYNATSEAVVNVSDLKGTVVKTVKGSTTSATINTSDLTSGLYVVTVNVDGVPSAVEKLVVK